MTRKRLSYALAVAALLFVGAGCKANQDAAVDVNVDAGMHDSTMMKDDGMKADVNADAAVKAEAPDTVDASIDAILKDSDDVMNGEKDRENDAAEIDSDKAAANAFGSASYDVETK